MYCVYSLKFDFSNMHINVLQNKCKIQCKQETQFILSVFFEEQIEVDLISLWNVLQPIGFGYSAAKIEEIQ